MRLIANSTKTEAESRDPHAWILDSAANAYITPFRAKLYNYCEFTNQVRVKGFAGQTELARGTGSIILIDYSGKRITLKDIVYIPESPDRILSLMKLCREEQPDFWFTTTETFEISFPTGVLSPGKSVTPILHIWTSSSPAIHTNAIVTHSAAKRANSQQHVAPQTMLDLAIQTTTGIFASAMHLAQRFANTHISGQIMTLHTALHAFEPNKLASHFVLQKATSHAYPL